ncbi:hypothetical protein AUEXF2481DRAFT_40820 [Aureobasidium subglaciale EXF-2481]|uniref:GAT domain-containing protein n=1 Tax=Aureobasidium subglaciale (strain EXF-2481) TaxID=1043005 RepID=A0A074YL72_AURSE|nr:uncharacterized protein AUEXF2481DRAFT_40820 [Aureobasidium subglaciale EXF-2481]KAI5212409.1 hypothetical protein E4T38_00588 [Aureobasidium subglaciale]KAI5234436.1 hypothetical protein E4T41_00587 [Aureobasidium subglaciale]KAI5268106.1 hypothetical protein E4T46_00587 [Aureobasidium subglaciale]KEQ94867.1 hypothetical protein AUEXF2481DRAFT_40820 [Aureobasidium subglaciale EXF-2481]
MKKLRAGFLKRTHSSDATTARTSRAPTDDSPESNATRAIRQFCEAPSDNSGEEVLHLPVIVEAAESSPQAAAAAAHQLRKCLDKDNKSRVQYNAIMLIRILADNPGPSFTRNIDTKFVSTVKDIVKHGKDPSVQQMMRETLDSLEAEKSHDHGLYDLLAMWRQVKGHGARILPQGAYRQNAPPLPPLPLHPHSHSAQPGVLPTPQELASRVEEARNTAKILLQLLQSTPADQVMNTELIKEFSDRCQSAQRSMQEYINCNSPPPDDDTLQTLIETNEQLSLAISRHQRAVLQARRALGQSPSPALGPNNPFAPPPPQAQPAVQQSSLQPASQPYATDPHTANSPVSPVNGVFSAPPPPGPPPGHPSAPALAPNNPFADPSDSRHNHDFDYTDYPQERRNYGPSLDTNPRPAYGGVTESYMGRQYSAANGLSMHGGLDTTITEEVSPVEQHHTQREVRYRY